MALTRCTLAPRIGPHPLMQCELPECAPSRGRAAIGRLSCLETVHSLQANTETAERATMQLKGLPLRHTQPCLLLQAPHRAPCPRSVSHSTRGARCVAQSERYQQRVEKGARQALPGQCADGSFPQLETEKDDDGWLPKRQPGSFPSTGVRRRFGGLTSAWERFTVSRVRPWSRACDCYVIVGSQHSVSPAECKTRVRGVTERRNG